MPNSEGHPGVEDAQHEEVPRPRPRPTRPGASACGQSWTRGTGRPVHPGELTASGSHGCSEPVAVALAEAAG
eukprot:6621007-Alexandrium_andersonii.AAC.1